MRLLSLDHPAIPGWASNESARFFGAPPLAENIWMPPLCAQRGGLSLTRTAIDFPSGEKRGEASEAGVFARTVTLPLPTSTIDTSDVVQSFALGVFVWPKAMREPSADQSKSSTL